QPDHAGDASGRADPSASGEGTMMLLDEIIPSWHVRSRYETVVEASPDRVAQAIESLRLDRDASWLVRLLFRARGLSLRMDATPRAALTDVGFAVLGERPGREIVFGIAGKFWATREMANLVRVPDARAFAAFGRPGQAKAAMNFLVEPLGDGRTLLSTETRVWCSDDRARRLFGLYWTLNRIPSGLIRVEALRAIARHALSSEPVGVTG
ncbi:MAG: hypothetical protein ACRDKS_16580, partial [Actinomycetota bacterium]